MVAAKVPAQRTHRAAAVHAAEWVATAATASVVPIAAAMALLEGADVVLLLLQAARSSQPSRLPDTCMAPLEAPSTRLRAALPAWARCSRWAAQVVEHGLTPEWLPASRPPRILKPDSHTLCQKYGGTHVAGMEKEIQKLIDLGSVAPVLEVTYLDTEDSVTSIMFPVPKPDGRTRPVINLKTINPYVRAIPFKMEGLKTVQDLLRKDWWMVKVDLADAFHHIPLHPNHLRFFRFLWKGTTYQWQVMPFGYRDAPRIFTKMMAVVAREARKRGVRLVVYIDDILLIAPTALAAQEALAIFLQLLRDFGFTLNIPKSVLTPTQVIEFLGVIVDSRSMTFALPPQKMEKIMNLARAMVRRAASNRPIMLIDLQRLIGTFQSVTPCVLPTRLHTNTLIEALRSAESHPQLQAYLGASAMADLNWWQQHLPTYNGRPIVPPPPDYSLDTDASGKGWGAVHFSRHKKAYECQGYFTTLMSSNTRELTAISLAVQSLTRRMDWKDCSVRVRTDNQTAMSYINRMGGREPHLTRITEEVHKACLTRHIFPTAEYLPGQQNQIADRLSRIKSNWAESHLDPSLFHLVDGTWGPHTLDAFASATNHQCKRYVSLSRPERKCMGIPSVRGDRKVAEKSGGGTTDPDVASPGVASATVVAAAAIAADRFPATPPSSPDTSVHVGGRSPATPLPVMGMGRSANIRATLREQGISDEAIDLAFASWKHGEGKGTVRDHDLAWAQWERWTRDHGRVAAAIRLADVVAYLAYLQGTGGEWLQESTRDALCHA